MTWAFCDTDSIAIANISNKLKTNDFKILALQICDRFKPLNPYESQANAIRGEKSSIKGATNSILQLEKVNFPKGKDGDRTALDPPRCLAVAAKRYALFNGSRDDVVIRKASGHGLGHLLAPYDEPPKQRRERIERIGVPLWQEDVWKEIVRAAETDAPDQARFTEMPGFDVPAASQYAATTPELLRWFDGYNERRLTGKRIFPFGFLLSLQSKSRIEMVRDQPEALSNELWRRREPRPAAPYFKKLVDAKYHAFDRERDVKIPPSWLKSLGRSLVRHHLHQETKFRGGEYDQRGLLERRHIVALGHRHIGKEADHIEESELIGEDAGPIEYPTDSVDRSKLRKFVLDIQRDFDISNQELADRAGASHQKVSALRKGRRIGDTSLQGLVRAAEVLRKEAGSGAAEQEKWREKLRAVRDEHGGRNKLAKRLGVNAAHLGRVLRGERPVTTELIQIIQEIQE